MPWKTWFLWQDSQSSVLWGVSSVKPVAAAWLHVTAVQAIGRWQVAQSRPELRLEAVVGLADPVAVVAARGRALEDALHVAGRARDREVLALEREGGGLVEGARGGPPEHGVVAGRAVAPEGAAVDVLVAVRARDRDRVPDGRPPAGGVVLVSLGWHSAQAIVACFPTKNPAVSFFFGCVNFATRNDAASWQVSQRGESWPRCGSLWQVRHSVEMPVKRTAVPVPAGNVPVSFAWHFAQGTVSCLPVSANFARVWTKRSAL